MGDHWLHPGVVEGGVDLAHCGGESQPDGGLRLLSTCSFMRSAALTRLVCAALHICLHRRMKAAADETPTSSSWLGNKGGWYPRQHSNGDSLEAADMWPLIAYSAQGSWVQEAGL